MAFHIDIGIDALLKIGAQKASAVANGVLAKVRKNKDSKYNYLSKITADSQIIVIFNLRICGTIRFKMARSQRHLRSSPQSLSTFF